MPKKNQLSSSASRRSRAQRRYNSQPAQLKRRAARNKSRADAIKAGKDVAGKDVNHVNRKTLKGKTVVQSVSKNRSNNSQFSKKRKAKRKKI